MRMFGSFDGVWAYLFSSGSDDVGEGNCLEAHYARFELPEDFLFLVNFCELLNDVFVIVSLRRG